MCKGKYFMESARNNESYINQVKQNNQKIYEIINEIIDIRKANNISLQDENEIDDIAKEVLKLETQKCIAIYQAEYGKECRGNKENVYLNSNPKRIGDCSGGTEGLGIGRDMNVFLRNLYDLLEKYDVQKSGAKFTKDYDGSERDQMDWFLQLKEINGIDFEYVLGALAHEAKHTYGLIGGSTFIKEGTTEQTTREDCDKYGMYMSPTSHTQEANFIRKLELIVGRDEIVEAGLYNEHIKMKESMFEQIIQKNSSVTIDELNEFFKISRYDDEKIDEHDKNEINDSKKFRTILEKFKENHPELVDEIESIKSKYDKMSDFDRYNSLSEKLNQKIPQVDFIKLIEQLDVLYDIQMKHKKEPNFYRDLYSKDWNEVLSEDELKKLSDVENGFGTETRAKSYTDLINPVNEYIKENNLDLIADRKKINEKVPNLDRIIQIQNEELGQLIILREAQKNQISNKKADKKMELSKSNLVSIAKQEEVSLEVEDALEDMCQLEKTHDLDKKILE